MLCTGKWVKKIVSCCGVFDLAVGQPQLFRKLYKNKKQKKYKYYFLEKISKTITITYILLTATKPASIGEIYDPS